MSLRWRLNLYLLGGGLLLYLGRGLHCDRLLWRFNARNLRSLLCRGLFRGSVGGCLLNHLWRDGFGLEDTCLDGIWPDRLRLNTSATSATGSSIMTCSTGTSCATSSCLLLRENMPENFEKKPLLGFGSSTTGSEIGSEMGSETGARNVFFDRLLHHRRLFLNRQFAWNLVFGRALTLGRALLRRARFLFLSTLDSVMGD